ncbi:MAG: M20/M25/M40 family metallo-hydrolase [bacterium]|nr:M20/M25/M40 family metallo-hydrolase [bacterium]
MQSWIILTTAAVLLTGCTAGPRVGEQTQATRSTEVRLYEDVRVLSEEFEDRNAENRGQLNDAGLWVGQRLGSMGYAVDLEQVNEEEPERGFNVVAELVGTTRPDEIIVIGAHYDAELNTPGADDNASGVAAMLELARRFAGTPLDRTVRWVGFTNEESSNSFGGVMGSFAYARAAKNRNESVVAMMSLEMLGYYDDAPGSQRYPFDQSMAAQLGMDLPDTGDFIGVVGRFEDRGLVESIGASMRSSGRASVVEAALPAMVRAIWRSDHGNFWLAGYNAVMITDTSEFRTPHYHQESDTIATLDFGRMAGVVDALEVAVRDLATVGEDD